MQLCAKQLCDWNCYAYYAEDANEQYWDYFKSELWWQLGNWFIKTYNNVKDFEYYAENFTKHGEIFIKQHLRILSTPRENTLDLLIPEMKK